MTRWGIIGCGDVTEVKSGPAFQKATGSALVAVMRRDLAKAQDYARRHGVPRAYDRAAALIGDPQVDAVYIATPPSSHCELTLAVAAAGKPCLVEKPMAMNHDECRRMIAACAAAGVPLWVAYYRRALPRFVLVRDLLAANTIGAVTSVHVAVTRPLATTERSNWRFNPAIAGAGLFFDLGSHCVDLLDFFLGPITGVAGFPINTGGAYGAEDVTAASFSFGSRVVGTGIWNFNAGSAVDTMTFTGTEGTLETPVFSDTGVIVTKGAERQVHEARHPPHVHQPLIQAIVDELAGGGSCPSTGESGARASWVLEKCLGR
jgi:predicted dehydrogenase